MTYKTAKETIEELCAKLIAAYDYAIEELYVDDEPKDQHIAYADIDSDTRIAYKYMSCSEKPIFVIETDGGRYYHETDNFNLRYDELKDLRMSYVHVSFDISHNYSACIAVSNTHTDGPTHAELRIDSILPEVANIRKMK